MFIYCYHPSFPVIIFHFLLSSFISCKHRWVPVCTIHFVLSSFISCNNCPLPANNVSSCYHHSKLVIIIQLPFPSFTPCCNRWFPVIIVHFLLSSISCYQCSFPVIIVPFCYPWSFPVIICHFLFSFSFSSRARIVANFLPSSFICYYRRSFFIIVDSLLLSNSFLVIIVYHLIHSIFISEFFCVFIVYFPVISVNLSWFSVFIHHFLL